MVSCMCLRGRLSFIAGSLSKEWAALANAVACGVMLACSFDLMHEGQPYGGGLVVVGILIGKPQVLTSGNSTPLSYTSTADLLRTSIVTASLLFAMSPCLCATA